MIISIIQSTGLFSFIYLIFAYGLWFLFPRYIQLRFSRIPRIKFVTIAYQIVYLFFLICSIFYTFKINTWFYAGISIYLIGLILYISGIYYFAINEPDKVVTGGVYRLFRHPVYLAFVLIVVGISVAAVSFLLFTFSVLIAILSFIIAKQEEKDCLLIYGDEYQNYKNSIKLP